MEKLETKVYRYLIYLQKYLEGDLKKFEKLCEEAENEEDEESVQTTVYPESSESSNSEYSNEEFFVARSTIPHTLTLFSAIDVLGFLTRNDKDYSSTINNFNNFFCGLKKNIDCLEVSVLRDIYRHGIAHSYFPKLNMAIAYRSEYPDDKMFLKEGDELILNVKHLKKNVIERLNEIINDETLYSNMEKQYNFLVDDYEKKCRRNIDELKSRL